MGGYYPLEKIILFDGVCNLCNASVQFVLRHNPKKNLKFASLQSEFGKNLLNKFQFSSEVKTIVFIKNGKAFVRSDAALEICKELNAGYPMFYFFKIIPRFIRDAVYDFIAKNRYRWFGKRNECWLPSDEFSDRFIFE